MKHSIEILQYEIDELKEENIKLNEDIQTTRSLIHEKMVESEMQKLQIKELEEAIKLLEKKDVSKRKKT